MRAFQKHLLDQEVFVQNVESRRQMFQHRGSGLDIVSSESHRHPGQEIALGGTIPRNSTQLISIPSPLPSADNGRSSSKVRSTKGPVSRAVRFLFLELDSSASADSIVQRACALVHLIVLSMQDSRTLRPVVYCAAEYKYWCWWDELSEGWTGCLVKLQCTAHGQHNMPARLWKGDRRNLTVILTTRIFQRQHNFNHIPFFVLHPHGSIHG